MSWLCCDICNYVSLKLSAKQIYIWTKPRIVIYYFFKFISHSEATKSNPFILKSYYIICLFLVSEGDISDDLSTISNLLNCVINILTE